MKSKPFSVRTLLIFSMFALVFCCRTARSQDATNLPAIATNQPAFPTNRVDPAMREALQKRLREALAAQNTNAAKSPKFLPNVSSLTNSTKPTRTPRGLNNFQTAAGTNIPVINAASINPTGLTNSLPSTNGVNPTSAPSASASANGANANPATLPQGPGATAGTAATTTQQDTVLKPGEIDFQDFPLSQLLEYYADLTGRTILQAQLPAVTIKLHTVTELTKTEAIQALDSVLAMNGITMIPVGDKFIKAVPNTLAQAQAHPFRTNDATGLPEADQYTSQIIQLKAAKPSEVIPALQPFAGVPNGLQAIDSSYILIIRDYAANIKRMLELVAQIDVVPQSDFESEVIPIRYAKADEIAAALSSLGAGSGSAIGNRSGGGTGGSAGSRGIGGSTTGSLNRGIGGAGGTTGGVGGQGTIGQARTSTFSDRLGSIINRAASGGNGEIKLFGDTKIIPDERTNSLLVFATKEDIKRIKEVIAKLDTVLPQVLIEAIIMEVTLDHNRAIAASLAQSQQSTPGNYFSGIGAVNNGSFLNGNSFGTFATNLNALPSGLSYWGNFGQDFQATLTATASDSKIHVLSRPHIQTSHGVTARLQVGQTVPEVSGTYFGGINGQASSQYQQQFVGIDLEVTPLINADGLVVMEISQDVQQLGPNYTIDGNQVPSTTTRSASSTVSVRDKDTIMLGGMISGNRSRTTAGVPYLMNIPILGNLFRSRSDTSDRVELIILIHPTVLKTPELAAIQAQKVKDHMPGVKAAEREDIIEENKAQRAADKIKVPVRE